MTLHIEQYRVAKGVRGYISYERYTLRVAHLDEWDTNSAQWGSSTSGMQTCTVISPQDR
jgi:hypothetical protein